MGPEFWKLDKQSKLKKCSERLLPNCSGDTEDCCKVVACEYCLSFEATGYETEYGLATGTTTWSGTIAGAAFFAFWEKDYTGLCQFIVLLNGIEISAQHCGEADCRDSSSAAGVIIDGHSGTLRWDKRLHHPLTHVVDELTNCKVPFCGDCECTCESLCVVVTEPPPYPEGTVDTTVLDPYSCDGLLPADCGFCDTAPPVTTTYGEIPNTETDPCVRPLWSATVAGRVITLALSRGYEGGCLFGGSIDGETVGPIEVADCKSLSASFTLEDGTQVDVSCKECGCDNGPPADAAECCDKVPCALCVTYEAYGEDPVTVFTEYGSGRWSGSVGGNNFLMYWHLNDYGECEFVVEYGGEIVLAQTVSEGASCDATSGSVAIGDDVLSWSIRPLTPLKRQDESTPFCGSCDCISECFCVTLVDPPQRLGTSDTFINGDTHYGELCNSAYECEPPSWSGLLGETMVSLSLVADRVSGACIFVVDVGDERFEQAITTCDDISVSFEKYDGTLVEIVSKKCECAVDTVGNCICGRPMGETLRLLWSSGNGTHGSAAREFLLTYGMIDDYEINCAPWSPGAFPAYRGSVSGTFPLPMGGTREDTLEVILVCECIGCEYCIYHRWLSEISDPGWQQHNYTIVSCECPAILDAIDGFITGNVWGYQVSDVTIYELESNCE